MVAYGTWSATSPCDMLWYNLKLNKLFSLIRQRKYKNILLVHTYLAYEIITIFGKFGKHPTTKLKNKILFQQFKNMSR